MAQARSGFVVLATAFACAVVIAAAMVVRDRQRAHMPPRQAAPGWHEGAGGYQAAVTAQRAASAPLLVYFHTDWCGYCKRFERDLLPSVPEDVIKVRLNPERSGDERAIADRYGVHGYPSLFVERGGARVRLHPFNHGPGGWSEATPTEFVAELLGPR